MSREFFGQLNDYQLLKNLFTSSDFSTILFHIKFDVQKAMDIKNKKF
jgi:hypothetical protein